MDMLIVFLFTVVVVVTISFCFKFLLYKHQMSGVTLPPGKMGWPIIGETLEFFMAGRRGSVEKFITDRMNKYSPKVFKTSLLGENFVVMCGTSANRFLFSNEDKLVTSWWPHSIDRIINSPSSNSQFSYENKKLRGFVTAMTKPEALQNNVRIMDSLARSHIETEWAPKGEVLAFELSKKYTFAMACRLILSIEDPEYVAKLATHFNTIMAGIVSLPINFPGTRFNYSIKAASNIRKELIAIIKQRRIDLLEKGETKMSQNILTHMLLSMQYPNDVSLADRILGLLTATRDSTSSVITFIIKYLAELPHVYTEVLKEQLEIANTKKADDLLTWEDIQKMKYSWNTANEVMRLTPPLRGAFREAITDFTYAGFTIPKGWKIHWTVHSTYQNPEYFRNPEKFDPTRFQENESAPYAFVPFGGGPRMCPGREIARIEILVFMHNLVTKFKWWTLIPDEKTIHDPAAFPANGLPIRLQPHKGEKY